MGDKLTGGRTWVVRLEYIVGVGGFRTDDLKNIKRYQMAMARRSLYSLWRMGIVGPTRSTCLYSSTVLPIN